MREITDESGRTWQAVAVPHVVAHLRTGALLAFRRGDDPEAAPYPTTIEFNSEEAAASAIRTMSEKELRRRLNLALTAAGVA